MTQRVSKMSTKKELEDENSYLQQNMMLLVTNNRDLQLRLSESIGLINHYELTIALIIGRLKEEQKALSSHTPTEP